MRRSILPFAQGLEPPKPALLYCGGGHSTSAKTLVSHKVQWRVKYSTSIPFGLGFAAEREIRKPQTPNPFHPQHLSSSIILYSSSIVQRLWHSVALVLQFPVRVTEAYVSDNQNLLRAILYLSGTVELEIILGANEHDKIEFVTYADTSYGVHIDA